MKLGEASGPRLYVSETSMTDEAPKRGRPKKAEMVTVRLLRNFYPKEDQRVPKGAIIEVTTAQAMDGMEGGYYERVKD